MFIIFEGHDLVGKTTLAEEFSRQTGIEIFRRFVVKKLDNWMKYIDVIAEVEYNALKHFKNDLILDRSFVSSIVYEKVYQRNYDMSYVNFSDFPKHLIVYMYLSKEKLEERLEERAEDFIIKKRIFELKDAYDEFFSSNHNLNVVRIDGSLELDEKMKLILDRRG